MKRMSKILAVVTSFIILISMFVLPANAAKSIVLSATSASGKQGDIVTISAKVSSGVKLEGCHIILTYDSSQLQYVEGSNKKGNIYNDDGLCSVFRKGNEIKCSAKLDPSKSVNGGTVFSVQFKILAASGTSTIKVSSDGGKNNSVYIGNGNYEEVPYITSNGKVTITKPVTGISLNKTSLTLKKGETSTISATVSPSDATNKTVSYTSSNTKVATVNSSGKITAKGGGTATITAKAGGKTATCKVTVNVAQTGIAVSGNSSKSVAQGSTITLKVAKVPSDATDSFTTTWTSADTNIATVSAKGVVTGVNLGATTITAKQNNWTVTYKITVTEKAPESSTEESSTEESTTETTTESTTESTTLPTTTEPVTEPNNEKNFFQIVWAEINDESNTVTKLYHYAMLLGVGFVVAIVSIAVTYFVTSGYYKSKAKKEEKQENTDITE